MESKEHKKQLKKVLKQNMFNRVLAFFVGLFFVACSIGLLLNGFLSIRDNIAATIVMSIFAILFLFFGIFWIVYSLKRIIPYFTSLKILTKGEYNTATIYSYNASKTRRGDGHNYAPLQYDSHFSISLKFKNNGEDFFYKTPYIYTKRQLDFLLNKSEFSIKYIRKTAVIVENFPPLPREPKLSELSKETYIKAIILQCVIYFDIILLIVGIIFVILLKVSWILIISVILLPIVTVLKKISQLKVIEEKKAIVKRENTKEK